MSYIDNHLMDGEQVVYRTKLHWIIFWGAIVFLILAFVAVIFFMMGRFDNNQNYKYIGGILSILFLAIALAWGIHSTVPYTTSEFGLTNKRVMIKTGFIKRESLEILLAKVEAMHVRQGIWGRILNYGTIDIRGTGGTTDTFDGIRAPLEFRMRVLEQVSLTQK
jgi:uncharacterized membrane protein YdbT with pleckstrin-like domain